MIVGAGVPKQDANICPLWLTRRSGPAHAVYFGTYEVVKDLAGGNAEDGKHHPGAAGLLWLQQELVDINTDLLSSSERRMCNNSK